jgi:hypothetical protein
MSRRVFSGLHVGLYMIVYIVLLIGVLFVSKWLTYPKDELSKLTLDQWKNLAAAATIGVTAVSAVMAAWLSIRNVSIQAVTAAELETVKKVLDKRIPSHGDLFGAASFYYRQLAPLETGSFDLSSIELAETKMKDSEGLILYVNQDYENHWRRFWQDARRIKEKVNREIPGLEERKAYWRTEAKTLATHLSDMKVVARTTFKV